MDMGIREKTRITSALNWAVLAFILIYLFTSASTSTLHISREAAYAVTASVALYFLVRNVLAWRLRSRSRIFDISLFAIDAGAMGFGVAVTGGQSSLFFPLYWASVIAGAYFFGTVGVTAMTAVAAGTYVVGSVVATFLDPRTPLDASQMVLRMFPLLFYAVMASLLSRQEEAVRHEKDAIDAELRASIEARRKLCDELQNVRLTPREKDVVRRMADGLNNRDIGAQLFISESTVKKHLVSIFEKLGVDNRTQAAVVADRAGLVESLEESEPQV